MPRIEGPQIPTEVRSSSSLVRGLIERGFTHDQTERVDRFSDPTGTHDVFVVSRLGKQGTLEVTQVTFPGDLNTELGSLLPVPFSTDRRLPDEEGA